MVIKQRLRGDLIVGIDKGKGGDRSVTALWVGPFGEYSEAQLWVECEGGKARNGGVMREDVEAFTPDRYASLKAVEGLLGADELTTSEQLNKMANLAGEAAPPVEIVSADTPLTLDQMNEVANKASKKAKPPATARKGKGKGNG